MTKRYMKYRGVSYNAISEIEICAFHATDVGIVAFFVIRELNSDKGTLIDNRVN